MPLNVLRAATMSENFNTEESICNQIKREHLKSILLTFVEHMRIELMTS